MIPMQLLLSISLLVCSIWLMLLFTQTILWLVSKCMVVVWSMCVTSVSVCGCLLYCRYSIVFIFFGFLFGLHLPLLLVGIILPFVWEKRGNERPWKTRMEYMWLIVFALLLLGHSILAGVVCKFKKKMSLCFSLACLFPQFK